MDYRECRLGDPDPGDDREGDENDPPYDSADDSETDTVEDEDIAFDYGVMLVHTRMIRRGLFSAMFETSEDEQSLGSETELDRYYESHYPPGFLDRIYYPDNRLEILFRVFMYERVHDLIPRDGFEEFINEHNIYLTSEQREHMLPRFNRILRRQLYWLY